MRLLFIFVLLMVVGCASPEERQSNRDKYLSSLMDNVLADRGLLVACRKEVCSERITNAVYANYLKNLSDFAAAYDPSVDQAFVVNVCAPIPQDLKADVDILNLIEEIRTGLQCGKKK